MMDFMKDERDLNISRAALHQISDRAAVYRNILSDIQREYEEFITAVKHRKTDLMTSHRHQKTLQYNPSNLKCYEQRAEQLRDRISVIQRDSAQLQLIIQKQLKTLKPHTPKTAGHKEDVLVNDPVDAGDVEEHLATVQQKRSELLKNIQCVFVQMKMAERQREELSLMNDKLNICYKQMSCLNEAIGCWETSGKEPLLEILTQTLELLCQHNDAHSMSSGLSKEEDLCQMNPASVRLKQLFEDGKYEQAALFAATFPHGVLINMETVQRLKSLSVNEGQIPPLLLFFHTLMNTVHAGSPLHCDVSTEAVRWALKYNYVDMVTHWVTQHKVMYSETLADVLSAFGDQQSQYTKDVCLALAHTVYTDCGMLKKAALSMCKRGLTNGAIEFIHQHRDFSIDDCVFVVMGWPHLDLLKALTQQYAGKLPVLSVGYICHVLLNTEHEDLALQLLEEIHTRGPRVLREVVLGDGECTVEVWAEIAAACNHRKCCQLSEEITSILLCVPGAVRISPDTERLMEHVFM